MFAKTSSMGLVSGALPLSFAADAEKVNNQQILSEVELLSSEDSAARKPNEEERV